MKKIIPFLLIFIAVMCADAQNAHLWNNKKCAVVLTYDDALDVHLDNAMPLLDSLNMKGTFYIIGSSDVLQKRMNEWRIAANRGHELGNHTLFHPCNGGRTGREFVTPENDLRNYTLDRIVSEILVTNTLLKAIDGKEKRSFAYTCGDTKVGDSLFYHRLKKDLTGARGIGAGMSPIDKVNLDNIDSYMINGHSAEYMIDLVKKASKTNSLLVFLFHGVGGGHNLNVALNDHSKLLHYLKDNEKDIWITTMIDAAEYVKTFQETTAGVK
jgi:sialate O-acetylesterase